MFVIVICCFILAACDGNNVNKIGSVDVTSAKITIPAAGGRKSIAVKSGNSLTAYSKDKWLSVSCEGDSVKMSAELNGKYSRYTNVIVKSGGDSTIINVSQYGVVFSLAQSGNITANDAGAKYSYKLKSNVPITFSNNKNWISGKYDSDSLYVSVSPNTTGKDRYGYLKYTYAGISDSIEVSQYDIKDFVGSWKLACTLGTSAYSTIDTTLDVTVTNPASDTLDIAIWNGAFTFHPVFKNNKLVISGGDYVGIYDPTKDYGNMPMSFYGGGSSSSYVNALLVNEETNGTGAFRFGATYTAALSYNSGRTSFAFEDDGSCVATNGYTGFSVNGIWLWTFTTETGLGMTTVFRHFNGWLFMMLNPVLYRDD